MDRVKNALINTKEFVSDHKVAITAIVTATVTTAVMIRVHRGAVESWNSFLDEKDLTTEYYTHLDPTN